MWGLKSTRKFFVFVVSVAIPKQGVSFCDLLRYAQVHALLIYIAFLVTRTSMHYPNKESRISLIRNVCFLSCNTAFLQKENLQMEFFFNSKGTSITHRIDSVRSDGFTSQMLTLHRKQFSSIRGGGGVETWSGPQEHTFSWESWEWDGQIITALRKIGVQQREQF